jgi:hypothetical protein
MMKDTPPGKCVKSASRDKLFLLTLLFLAAVASCDAQVKIQGGFLSDSLKIGEETAFYLSARYPSEATVLFPDSTHRFFPFELTRKKYFPTETANGVSRDSTIYFLTTYEVERLQGLHLPVYVVNEQDCTLYRSNADTVRIIQLVSNIPDSLSVDKLPLKIDVAYQPVDYQLNYYVMLLIGAGLLVILLVIWIFFGNRISRHFKARKLLKHHQAFLHAYERIIAELQGRFSPVATESALSLWKKYLESLEAKPYTKLTSRETVRLLGDEFLGSKLRAIDKAIYGNDHGVVEPLQHLRGVAQERFSKKLEQVKHGK